MPENPSKQSTRIPPGIRRDRNAAFRPKLFN